MKTNCMIIEKNMRLNFLQVKFAVYEILHNIAIQNLNLHVSAWCRTVIMAACL